MRHTILGAGGSIGNALTYEFPYHFDSSKFNNHFNYTPVNYEEGIKTTIEFIKNKTD
ncbi:MAG: hypothetical protein PHV53_09335 [Fermentimonas sp.]|nr:hypothetical protein [Fermentimonas sp.]